MLARASRLHREGTRIVAGRDHFFNFKRTETIITANEARRMVEKAANRNMAKKLFEENVSYQIEKQARNKALVRIKSR